LPSGLKTFSRSDPNPNRSYFRRDARRVSQNKNCFLDGVSKARAEPTPNTPFSRSIAFRGRNGSLPAGGSPPFASTVQLSGPLWCAAFLPAGNSAGCKKNHMTSYRKLAVRTDRGHVQEPAETYTTRLYIQTDDTVDVTR